MRKIREGIRFDTTMKGRYIGEKMYEETCEEPCEEIGKEMGKKSSATTVSFLLQPLDLRK
jgi:hypothetical protein